MVRVDVFLQIHLGFYSLRHGDTPASMQKMAVVFDTDMAIVYFCLRDFHYQRSNPLFNPRRDEERLSDR